MNMCYVHISIYKLENFNSVADNLSISSLKMTAKCVKNSTLLDLV